MSLPKLTLISIKLAAIDWVLVQGDVKHNLVQLQFLVYENISKFQMDFQKFFGCLLFNLPSLFVHNEHAISKRNNLKTIISVLSYGAVISRRTLVALSKRLFQIFPLYHAIFYKHTKIHATIHTHPHDANLYYYRSLSQTNSTVGFNLQTTKVFLRK